MIRLFLCWQFWINLKIISLSVLGFTLAPFVPGTPRCFGVHSCPLCAWYTPVFWGSLLPPLCLVHPGVLGFTLAPFVPGTPRCFGVHSCPLCAWYTPVFWGSLLPPLCLVHPGVVASKSTAMINTSFNLLPPSLGVYLLPLRRSYKNGMEMSPKFKPLRVSCL